MNQPDKPRYKGFANIEREARYQLEQILDGCKSQFLYLAPEQQTEVVNRLRPLAQKTILNALEGRTSTAEKNFGYEWSNALAAMEAQPQRTAAARYLLDQLPEVEKALKEPVIQKRIAVEWLYSQTVGRIRSFTPYLTQEDREIDNWREQCPDAYQKAVVLAKKLSSTIQERSRPKTGGPPTVGESARQLSYIAHLIAARKLFIVATEVSEFFEERLASIGVKIPMDLQGYFQPKIYARFGLKPQPVNYRPATPSQMQAYESLLTGMNGNILKNLQDALCPWTAEQAMHQKIGGNLLADVYFKIIKPQDENPTGTQLDKAVFDLLKCNLELYKLLGFSEAITPDNALVLENFISSQADLGEFLDRPRVQEVFRAYRVDQTLVQMCLNAAVAYEIVRSVKLWRPQAVSLQDPRIVAQAKSTLPHIMQDLGLYHNALMETDYLSLRKLDFYKEALTKLYAQEVSEKERKKLESFYKVMAVVVVARSAEEPVVIPKDWEKIAQYRDMAKGLDFCDYQYTTPNGTAIVCLAKGASTVIAEKAVNSLLNLKESACIDADGLQGIRISEYSFNELQTSCLHARSIARMQFYTSFSAADTLEILKGITDEPTDENIIESLRPCFVLKYKDHVFGDKFYCRIKPAEMVRVKYRTPTGENKNPCWDASQIIGDLSPAEISRRCADTNVALLLIEGEKKAALLAQIALDQGLPLHVISLPGVWMGVYGAKKYRQLVDEISKFQLVDANGKARNCLIFFDNDKAFNAAVMDALLQTAAVMQRSGGKVFVPHIPFGKKIKGADDYALDTCVPPNFDALLQVIYNAILVPTPPPPVKYPSEEQKRVISKWLDIAEHIDDLQRSVRKAKIPAESPALRELFLILAPDLLKLPSERIAAELYDSQTPAGRKTFIQVLAGVNPALAKLRESCQGIPDVSTGPKYNESKS